MTWCAARGLPGGRSIAAPGAQPIARPPQVTVIVCCVVMAVALLAFYLLKKRPIYLVDFAVCKPPEE